MDLSVAFPRQMVSSTKKGESWRKACVEWGANRTYFNYSPVRKDVVHMKINYDLLNGIIHMEDVAAIINPGDISTAFVPEKIQHYPIINSKINTLRGEEGARVFDWRVIVTNPNAISKMEEDKRKAMDAAIQELVENTEISDVQAQQDLQADMEYFNYSYQDRREKRGNELMKHYTMEDDFDTKFNDGLVDAAAAGMEAYQCAIVGGEPALCRLNPMKLRVFHNGYSNRIEDAGLVIYEDYWSREKIIDTYYDELSEKDIKWLTDDMPDFGGMSDLGEAGNVNDAAAFRPNFGVYGENGILVEGNNHEFADAFEWMDGGIGSTLLPYDVVGNVRVVQVWWKSPRKILKVKSFDEDGNEVFDFYPDTYIPDKDAGESAIPMWVNQAWHGVKIGENIYVAMRPCLVQSNSMSNPSRCNFGIVGTLYNVNESRPYTLVDMMKPYNYLYDAIHAKLIDLIATNWGKLLELDLAMKPHDWEVDKWLYFARANKVLVRDSFNESNKGSAQGVIAGGLNNASKGYIDADWGNSIQNYINLLQWTKDSMSDLVGINRQREGNTYNRETVGGIERAVLQSSYITDWLFKKHDDTKRRVMECFLEYTKAAIRGRSKKFQYILSDGSRKIMEIDGDEFNECDYGLVVDNSSNTQKLDQQIETIAQAALQNQTMDFSSILKLYQSISISEKIHIVEEAQRRMEQRQQQMQEQQAQIEQQKVQAEMQLKQQELESKDLMNQRDNETSIKVAEINSRAEYMRLGIYAEENDEELVKDKLKLEREKLAQQIKEFDRELRQRESEQKDKKEIELKKIEASKQKAKSSSK